MKRLYAPWRTAYATSTDSTKKVNSSHQECVFCSQLAQHTDETHFIIKRFTNVFVMLNCYPYNAGHLMVLPNEHKGTLQDLSPAVRHEFIDVITLSTDILMRIVNAQGINVGLNIGKASGAGIPSHLHMHSVPRWDGDTNFMTILGETKVISVDLHETYIKLKKAFENVSIIAETI